MSGPDDPDGAALGRLLTDLADDPDAPPTSVSALSVIAAATSGAPSSTVAAPPVAKPASSEAEAEAVGRVSLGDAMRMRGERTQHGAVEARRADRR